MALSVNQLAGFGGGVSNIGPSSLTYLSSPSSNTNTSSYSFSGVSTGAADENRKILICVGDPSGGGGGVPNTVELDDGVPVSATKILTVSEGNVNTTFWIASFPTGTSASIDVTFPSTQSSCGISVYRLVNYSSTPYDTGSYTGVEPGSASIDCEEGGCVVGFITINALGTTTWTNLTEDVENATDTIGYSAASSTFASAQVGLTVTANRSIGGDCALGLVAFSRGL